MLGLAFFDAIKVSFSLAYLVKLTAFYYPWLYVHDVTLRRREITDQSPMKILSLESLVSIFPVALFLIRIGQWWGENGHAKAKVMLEENCQFDFILDEKEPPCIVSPHRGVEIPLRGTCALCKQSPCTNPTALPSGYVFCHICILQYLRREAKCPVTDIYYSEADLRNIFQ